MVVSVNTFTLLSTIIFNACSAQKAPERGIHSGVMKDAMMKTFSTELEKNQWLNTQENQSLTMGIRCTFAITSRQCYLGESNEHPISIGDTRLGIQLSSRQRNDGWLQVEGVWKPSNDTLSIERVDLRIDKVLNTGTMPLSVRLN